MTERFTHDLKNAIVALECLIIDYEEDGIRNPRAGDDYWDRVEDLKLTLNNFKLLRSIYGN